MPKSQLYQNFSEGNAKKLVDFLVLKGVWNSPELDIKITIKFVVNGECVEFPLYENLPKQHIQDILNKFGFSYSDFENYLANL